MSKSDIFGLMGTCLLALFGFAVWPPLSLAVFGLAFLRIAYALAPITSDAEAGDDT